jgi:hypothetical protein
MRSTYCYVGSNGALTGYAGGLTKKRAENIPFLVKHLTQKFTLQMKKRIETIPPGPIRHADISAPAEWTAG